MSSAPGGSRSGSTPNPSVVEVRRIQVGESVVFRLLSESYVGWNTHWDGHRTQLCLGAGCSAALHKVESVWKGYSAAEELDELASMWRPCVLELTEVAELEMRNKWARGQTWKLTRSPKRGKKNLPMSAELVGSFDSGSIRAPFDISPILLHLYHKKLLPPAVPNPMMPRLRLEPEYFTSTRDSYRPVEKAAEEEKRPRKTFAQLQNERAERLSRSAPGEIQAIEPEAIVHQLHKKGQV